MMYALFEDKRILAEPKAHAFCPLCESELIPKCGEVKIWPWEDKVTCQQWQYPFKNHKGGL